MAHRETIEEFLARGGQIQKIPPHNEEVEQKVNPTTPSGGLMTLAEGSLFYSEMKPKVRKQKDPPPINVSALPQALLKYVKNLKTEEQ